MQSIINKHNNRIMSNTANEEQNQGCKCRNQSECPLQNICETKNVIYKATVTTKNNNIEDSSIDEEEEEKVYIGVTENEFKERYTQHKSTFKNQNSKN